MYIIYFDHTHPIRLSCFLGFFFFFFSDRDEVSTYLKDVIDTFGIINIDSFVWEVDGKLSVPRFLTASHAVNSQWQMGVVSSIWLEVQVSVYVFLQMTPFIFMHKDGKEFKIKLHIWGAAARVYKKQLI